LQDSTRPPELRPVLSVFHPVNVFFILAKNAALKLLIKFNGYMVQLLEHERQAMEAEEVGQQPPPPPNWPDFTPDLVTSLYMSCREVTCLLVRRLYEHAAFLRLGASRVAALLRDIKPWVRDVLAVQHRAAPVPHKYVKYQFAMLHATLLFWAAECTVACGIQIYKISSRKDLTTGGKLVAGVQVVVLQAARCTFAWVSVSIGGAVGSLAAPGIGTQLGAHVMDFAANAAFRHATVTLFNVQV